MTIVSNLLTHLLIMNILLFTIICSYFKWEYVKVTHCHAIKPLFCLFVVIYLAQINNKLLNINKFVIIVVNLYAKIKNKTKIS